MAKTAIFCDNVVIAQIMPMANIDPAINLDTYTPKQNEVVIYCPTLTNTLSQDCIVVLQKN